MIELAVVDLAGTTVRDDGAVEGAFVDALRFATDGPVDDATLDFVRRTMGMSKISVFRELLRDEDAAQTANAEFEAAYARRVTAGEVAPLPGAEAALRELRESGVYVSLTTGFSSATRDLLIEALGWRDLADLTVSPDATLRGRPAPDLVLASVISLEVEDVRSVAVVGDTCNDLISGTRAGASVVAGVLTGAHDARTLASAPHTHLLGSIAEFPAALRSREVVLT